MGQSRNENILENMLGAHNPLGEPQSREEYLLMQILEQGGGGGSSTLAGLTDVSVESPSDKQVLQYNATSEKWENTDSEAGEIDLIDEATGDIANFETNVAAPLVKCLANIVAHQESGTPTPSNPLPISGHTEANITRCGVNLFDNSTFVKGRLDNGVVGYAEGTTSMTITDTGVNFTTNTAYRGVVGGFMQVKPNVTYYLKFTSSNSFIIYVDYYDISQNWITRSSAITINQNIVIPNDCYYARISIQGNTSGDYTFTDISFNYPNTDTTYHAYNGDTVTISFGQTVYGGVLDVTNGTGSVTLGDVDLGDLNWQKDTSGDNWGFYINSSEIADDFIVTSVNEKAHFISEIYEVVTANGNTSYSNNYVIFQKTNGQIFIVNRDYSDNTSFKTAMRGKKLVYELATPVTLTLTPTQVRALVGVNNVFSDVGDVDIEYANDNAADVNTFIESCVSLQDFVTDISGTLETGDTEITLSSSAIRPTSTIEVFNNLDVPYVSKTVSTGSITLTFDAQESDMSVKVRVS